ncbi:hypothetical protein VTK73DRAFT_8033 [Phialemonium thermophilum]|uniref:Carboxylesterase type B domain-containing protein n=1 Tax=Phialemonium thermophilum TaxID=223376 RepID=A0ABR3WB34_9PEZI
MSSATHKTLQVGNVSVTGRVSEEGVVASFLGIPFAKIPERWRQATLIDAFEGAERADLDATRYGPIVPQPPNPSLIGRPDLRASELDCLNLNVWAPASAVDTTAELPVIVWVHGGGYMWSHNSATAPTWSDARSSWAGPSSSSP